MTILSPIFYIHRTSLFFSLHEAAAATGDNFYKEAEDKLAEFFCRIQVKAEDNPQVDGGWYRAFDMKKWEFWGSSADHGWGPWSIETGWTQGWITAILAAREQNFSIWDHICKLDIKTEFKKYQPIMLSEEDLQDIK